MGRRGKGELTYKQHEDAVKRKLYEQKKEIERLSLENATLRIKIKDQDKKAEIYNMMIDEAVVDLETALESFVFWMNLVLRSEIIWKVKVY